MNIELAIVLTLGFSAIYALLIRVFSTLFRITGLTVAKSRFQAISLLTNCGFTTSESEIISTNKVRRQIATAAMITGYIFSVIIVSLIFNLINSFNANSFKDSITSILIAVIIFILLLIFFKLPFISKGFDKLIEKIARKIMKRSKSGNIISLLDIYGKDAIAEISITNLPHMMQDKPLSDLNLREAYHLNVLSLKRKNKLLTITKNTIFQDGDVIVVFGPNQSIKDIFEKNIDDIDSINTETQKIENSFELIDNYGHEAMIRITINKIPKLLINTPLIESGMKSKYCINILMLKRNNQPEPVDKNTIIKEKDTIVVFGPYNNIKKFFTLEK